MFLDEEGRVLKDDEEICRAWERWFLKEFFGNGVIAEAALGDVDRSPFDFAAPKHGESHFSQQEWSVGEATFWLTVLTRWPSRNAKVASVGCSDFTQ